MGTSASGERLGGRKAEPGAARKVVGVTPISRASKEVYRIAFSVAGRECREIVSLPHTKGNLAFCERLRAEIIGKIARGEFKYADYFPESPQARETAVSDLPARLDAYLAVCERTMAYSTYLAYKKAVTHHLKPWLQGKSPADLKPSDVRDWVGAQKVSLKTISNRLLPLRAVLDEAVQDDIIKTNPLRSVKLARSVSVQQRDTAWEPDPFTLDELRSVLSKLAEDDPPQRWLFQFWAFTGLRTGELIGLRLARCDARAGTIRIQETTTEGRDKDRPKTKSGVRTITLLPAALQALKAAGVGAGAPADRVFTHPDAINDECAWGYNSLTRAWKAACERAGVRYRNPYQLRHTFASHLLSEGRPPAEIAALLGHKTVEMVIRVYGRWIGSSGAAARAPYGAQPLLLNEGGGWI